MLGGVIYLHDISETRCSDTVWINLPKFNRICKDAAFNKIVLVTTKWGRLPENSNDGLTREAELKHRNWKPMIDQGSQVQRFRGDQKSAWEVLTPLLLQAEKRSENDLTHGGIKMLQERDNAKIDEILRDGKETDIVIPCVLTLSSIWIALKVVQSIMGATGAGKSSVSSAFCLTIAF